jgi:hypothetical protein
MENIHEDKKMVSKLLYSDEDDENTNSDDENTNLDDENTNSDDENTNSDDENTNLDDENTNLDDENTNLDDENTNCELVYIPNIYNPKNTINISNIINEIIKCDKPLFFNNNSDMKGTIFYIGLGKTGSMTLCNSIINKNIFHSHSTSCYDFYCNNILTNNNLTCYDLVKMFGIYFSYKPLIIETIREPISQLISLIGEFTKYSFEADHPYCHIIPKNLKESYLNSSDYEEKTLIIIQIINIIISTFPKFIFTLENDKYFNDTEKFSIYSSFNKEKYLFKEFDDYSLLILRFENIKEWGDIFCKLGIEYSENNLNLTDDCDFTNIKQNLYKNRHLLNLTSEMIKKIYSQYNNYLHNFYSESEINNFIKKWKCD